MIYHKVDDKYPDLDEVGDLSDLAPTVSIAAATLRPHKRKFDCIVVTGMSGVIVGVPLALRLRKPVCVLRKRKDGSHQSGLWINLDKLSGRALWVDDFVDGGYTMERVEKAVEKLSGVEIVGRYLYRDDELRIGDEEC